MESLKAALNLYLCETTKFQSVRIISIKDIYKIPILELYSFSVDVVGAETQQKTREHHQIGIFNG